MTGPGSPSPTGRGCSTGSPGSTAPVPARPEAPAWAWRSCRSWYACTPVPSRWAMPPRDYGSPSRSQRSTNLNAQPSPLQFRRQLVRPGELDGGDALAARQEQRQLARVPDEPDIDGTVAGLGRTVAGRLDRDAELQPAQGQLRRPRYRRPQRQPVLPGQRSRLPVRSRPPHVLVVDEELQRVGRPVERPDRTQRPRRRTAQHT